MKNVILIAGKKRSGKGYTAEYLKSKLPNSIHIGFADLMKQIVAEMFGISLDELEIYKNEPQKYGVEIRAYHDDKPQSLLKHITFRQILQTFGSGKMKEIFGKSVWAILMKQRIEKTDAKYIIISDWRFREEYEALVDDFDVTTILVEGKNQDISDTHISENALTDWRYDYILDNTEHDGRLEKQILDFSVNEFIQILNFSVNEFMQDFTDKYRDVLTRLKDK